MNQLEKELIIAWPNVQPLESDLPPVQPISQELLPVALRPLVCDTAERMSVPLDFPAIVALLCLAGCVSRRAVIEPMENDVTWLVTPNLWGALIARPGEMKSPLIDAITAPVEAIQRDWQQEFEDAIKRTNR